MEKEDKIDLSGAEIVALAGSIAICLFEKYSKEDVRKLRTLFQSIASNLLTLEIDRK